MGELNALLAELSAKAQETYTTREARAAMRCVLGDAAQLCDTMQIRIKAANPGRRKGSVSSVGLELADVAKRLGDLIWEMRGTVKVPVREIAE